jgi:hypothetical protein
LGCGSLLTLKVPVDKKLMIRNQLEKLVFFPE